MIRAIAARELRSYFTTPLAWVLTASGLFLLAWLLLMQLEIYLKIQPQLVARGIPLGVWDLVIRPTLSYAGLLLLLLVPLLGMRIFSSELQSGRINLLLASPATPMQLVLGKWLGLVIAFVPLVSLITLMILALQLGSSFDAGRLLCSILGLLLLTAMAAALITWSSSLTRHSVIAATLAYSGLILMWLLETDGPQNSTLSQLALSAHLTPFFTGQLRLFDTWYFIALSIFALVLAVHRIWRLGGGR